ncbi:hypothetical protein ACFLUT_00260 [Chloroflexota bacterium]
MTARPEKGHSAENDLAQDILSRYREVLRASRERESLLRFGRRTVAVSAIAQQFYCEMALHLSILRPMRPTREMQSGTAGHEAVAALGVPMTHEESIAQAIVEREKPLCIYEFRIGWEHNGVPIVGFVDEAWFQGGAVEMVAERKFSRSLGIYAPYHIQAGLYCLGLGEMGFDTGHAQYCVTVFRRECHDCEKLGEGICPLQSGETSSYECERGAGVRECFPFGGEKTTSDLEWALDYWTYEREPEPDPGPRKCRACRWRAHCEYSLAEDS